MTIYSTRGLKPSHTPPLNRGHHNERVRRIGLLETDRAGARSVSLRAFSEAATMAWVNKTRRSFGAFERSRVRR
jgi:hypothetical protein